jgi:oligopeptide/dipeptide ABC transporter ATP-binding protein
VAAEPLLKVEDLRTYFFGRFGTVLRAVDGVSFDIMPGEIVALVGESGCGKSVSCLSFMHLNPPTSKIMGGKVMWRGTDLLKLEEKRMREIRGKEIAMIFQDPLSSLNPLITVGEQIAEAFEVHFGLSRKEGRKEAVRMLDMVCIPRADKKAKCYPFELSGGMRQRVMMAIALSCKPDLLIADEPTTSLDATIQAQLLELIGGLSRDAGTGVLLVTHDLGIVARYADRVHIMYAGSIVESAPSGELYTQPLHPYTVALLHAIPRLDRGDEYRLTSIPGQPPRLDGLDAGCAFRPRCPKVTEHCGEAKPASREASPGHKVACWLMQER